MPNAAGFIRGCLLGGLIGQFEAIANGVDGLNPPRVVGVFLDLAGHWVGEPAQFGAQGEAVEFRHHDIEQNQVRLFLQGFIQAGGAVGGG